MSKKMLIDATHAEETRAVVVDDGRLEELDVETSTKKQIKGNIYLAKVIRVEPSLQAAFVEYGGNRHGFLAFNEIHPDYYQLPTADLEKLKRELEQEVSSREDEPIEKNQKRHPDDVETVSETDADDVYRPRRFTLRKYRIQEVIHHGQIMLVQVVKEERGNKGAAMTTYLSLAGRYSVLMPKNAHSGGVSRKIVNVVDRKRLKKIVESLPVLEGQSVIIRTAGKERTKAEIKRDFEYLNKTWEDIVEKTMVSIAPALIHEEGNLIKRTLRDGLTDDIEEVLIEGEEAFKNAKAFIKLLMPRWVKKVKEYAKDIPLFQAFNIENQMEEMNQKNVYLKSGGYLVIDQAEALVAIDVNSGRATREHNIEETALKTNLEAADEVARQMRLRDLAGLVVIDFIDMDEPKNNIAVERRMKEALKKDRARVQMGKITGFGLMEISRQRLRSSLLETGHHVCPMCQGTGIVRSRPSCAMHALHILESAAEQHQNSQILMTVPTDIALYVLNNKRGNLAQIEEHFDVEIRIEGDATLLAPTDYRMEYHPLPQKDKKGFFARAISNLLPVMKKETKQEEKLPKKQEITEVVSKKEGLNKDSQKSPVKNKHHHDRNRKHGSEQSSNSATSEVMPQEEKVVDTDEKTSINVEEKLSEPMLMTGEENFKVVHQEAMTDFDTTEKKEKSVRQNKKARKDVTRSAKKQKALKETPTAEENEKKVEAVEVALPVVQAETIDLKQASLPSQEENTEEKLPKKGWWNNQ